jgi:branched-chain amino acid transport system substrate-binding protein
MSRRLSAVLAALLVASVAAVGALAAGAAAPGITSKSIKLGGTFPLSGAASPYAPIPKGMQIYFSYINARRGPDKKRGVGGRQIIWKYVDDAYNPANTVQQTRALVEQDKVFALVGGLGTEPQQSVVDYLNQSKVPDLFVALLDLRVAQLDLPVTLLDRVEKNGERCVRFCLIVPVQV